MNILGGTHLNSIKEITGEDVRKLISEIPHNLTLGDQIGKGGQKQVYKVSDNQNNEFVFKVLIPNYDSIERLKREILAVKIINHENIPKVIDSNVESVNNLNEIVWLIEEYIEGESLRDELNKGKLFPLPEVVHFIDTILSILEISESNNIVHRDIKPENIIYATSKKFWLIDFGISRHLDLKSITESNSPFGQFTFGYSASEQFRNRKKEIDIRADLFSLGVVIAEIIIGYNPYLKDTNDIIQVIKNIENQPLPLLRIKGDSQFFLAKFIKTLGDNRISRRPRTIKETVSLFNIVKATLQV